MKKHIKRVDRILKYKGSILDIYTDVIETPDGHRADWDFIDHRGAAAVVPVLDDGRITDSQGRTVDFKNTIIIMTSNLGSQELLEGIEADGSISTECEDRVMNELKGHFRPEFLNRLDEIIMFKPLTKDNIGHIINLLMDDLNKRLVEKEIKVELTDSAKKFITDNGYDPIYGARPLKRYLQKHVETLAAKLILGDGVRTGDTILIDEKDGQLSASAVPAAV